MPGAENRAPPPEELGRRKEGSAGKANNLSTVQAALEICPALFTCGNFVNRGLPGSGAGATLSCVCASMARAKGLKLVGSMSTTVHLPLSRPRAPGSSPPDSWRLQRPGAAPLAAAVLPP